MCGCNDQSHCECTSSFSDEAIVVSFPALIKSSLNKAYERIIDFECSNESSDSEGDVILQDALLGSSERFVRNGHIDIDHFSELADNPNFSFLGIKNGSDWIVGNPLEVKDLGKGRTGIKGQIYSNKDGSFAPDRFKYDALWKSLQTTPPMRYYASVYGFPGKDTEKQGCAMSKAGHEVCATRFLVKSFDWRSVALTRHPVNDSITDHVRIMTAKSFAAKMSYKFPNTIGFNRDAIRKSYTNHMAGDCPETSKGTELNIDTLRKHFFKCENMTYAMSDLYALATRELLRH